MDFVSKQGGGGVVEKQVTVAVSAEQRGGDVGSDFAAEDLADDFSLGRARGEQPDFFRGQELFEADGQSPGGDPGVGDVLGGRSHGLRMEFDPASWAVRQGAGLVHAEVAVESDAKEGEVESRADGEVEVMADLVQIGRIGVEDMEFRRRQIDMVDEMISQHVGAAAGVVGSQAAELIQGEGGGIPEGNEALAMAGDHGGVERVGCMPGSQAHLEPRLDPESVAPETCGGFDPGFEGVKVQ